MGYVAWYGIVILSCPPETTRRRTKHVWYGGMCVMCMLWHNDGISPWTRRGRETSMTGGGGDTDSLLVHELVSKGVAYGMRV